LLQQKLQPRREVKTIQIQKLRKLRVKGGKSKGIRRDKRYHHQNDDSKSNERKTIKVRFVTLSEHHDGCAN
jgi:hypothetical protein